MKHLSVVTHPQATHHVDRLVGGWYDSDLTEVGLAHAARIAERLRGEIPEKFTVAVFSSDLRRCAKTAATIAELLGARVQATADLREISYGEAEGKPQAWLDARFIYPPRTGNRLDHGTALPAPEPEGSSHPSPTA